MSLYYPRHDFKMSLKLWKNEGHFGDQDCGDRHYFMSKGDDTVTPTGGGTWPNTPAGEYYFVIVYLNGDAVDASGTRT